MLPPPAALSVRRAMTHDPHSQHRARVTTQLRRTGLDSQQPMWYRTHPRQKGETQEHTTARCRPGASPHRMQRRSRFCVIRRSHKRIGSCPPRSHTHRAASSRRAASRASRHTGRSRATPGTERKGHTHTHCIAFAHNRTQSCAGQSGMWWKMSMSLRPRGHFR